MKTQYSFTSQYNRPAFEYLLRANAVPYRTALFSEQGCIAYRLRGNRLTLFYFSDRIRYAFKARLSEKDGKIEIVGAYGSGPGVAFFIALAFAVFLCIGKNYEQAVFAYITVMLGDYLINGSVSYLLRGHTEIIDFIKQHLLGSSAEGM